MSKKAKRLPTISLCVIARDEEQFIAGCLESAKPYVDEMVVVDTGSVDRTVEIAKAIGARVEHFTWIDDFAAARNAAIEHATSDWIFMLDADERLEPESGLRLRQLAAELPAFAHGYAVTIESRTLDDGPERVTATHVSRMLPRCAEVRYDGAIHEDLRYLPDPKATILVHSGLRVLHYGYDTQVRKAKNKQDRNLRLLERRLETSPDDPRTQYYVAREMIPVQPQKALELIKCFVAAPGDVSPEFHREGYLQWMRAAVAVDDAAEVAEALKAAEAADAISSQVRAELAAYEERLGNLAAAEQHLLLALDAAARTGMTQTPGVGGWGTRLHLARIYAAHESLGKCIEQLAVAFEDAPSYIRARIALMQAQMEARVGDNVAAARSLDRAAAVMPDTLEAHEENVQVRLNLRAALAFVADGRLTCVDRAIAAEDWQAAYDAALPLDPADTAELARLLAVARGLHAADAADAALDILGRALNLPMPRIEVYRMLIPILVRLGRYDEAQDAAQILDTLMGVDRAKLAA